MKNLKKNLQTVNRELKTLAKKVDKIVVVVGKLEKAKVAKKPKAKAAKKKPVRKTVAKKVAVKKRAVKKVAAKKTTKTVIDTVLAIIRRSKKGVNTAALMKKTGFSEKQIHNNVYKLKKQGKIKSVGRGLYLKA
jgi:nicotinamide mononucleotide adenylyltransferase